MQLKNVKMSFAFAALMIGLLLIGFYCSKSGFEGVAPENQAPRCFLANIPPDLEKFSRNPVLHWYATDIDGFIKEYRYVVKKAVDINDDPLEYAEQVMESGDYSEWTRIIIDSVPPGKSPHQDTIRSYASYDPAVYTKQYMFIQAVDNHGAISNLTDTSETGDVKVRGYRGYSRNNHPPETYLDSLPITKVFFSLPDTTDLYKGIGVGWSGSDSLDYEKAQPPFEYYWQVFGPFPAIDSADTTDPSKFIYESKDSLGNVWTSDESTILFNLYRNQGEADTTRANYFLFKVVARDDAYVPDTSPAMIVFYAVEPGFERDILLIDNTTYIGQHCVLKGAGRRIYPDDIKVVEYQNYYKNIFRAAAQYNGVTLDTLYWYFIDYIPNRKLPPALDTLLRYKLIINITENHRPIYDTTYFSPYADYLNLGGKMMFIGWNIFAQYVSGGLHPYGISDFPYKYFGVAGEYYTSWNLEDFVKRGPSKKNTPEEFIRAERGSSDIKLPEVLGVDINQLRNYYVTTDTWDSLTWTNNYPFRYCIVEGDTLWAEPWVNYYVKSMDAEALYRSKSCYDDYRDFEEKFGQVSIDGKVCAVRQRGESYKTAAFGFSLYCMPQEQAIELMKVMLGWFFEDN